MEETIRILAELTRKDSERVSLVFPVEVMAYDKDHKGDKAQQSDNQD